MHAYLTWDCKFFSSCSNMMPVIIVGSKVGDRVDWVVRESEVVDRVVRGSEVVA